MRSAIAGPLLGISYPTFPHEFADAVREVAAGLAGNPATDWWLPSGSAKIGSMPSNVASAPVG
ncbi:hypothetical protein BKA01_002854 [Pseudonocardia eucalypti]|nr:hypothetical protein [Pseudonocardia eucalypti]